MSVYNAEEYIEDSLDSVFNQPFKDFEIIIVDDKSTDGCLEKINKYRHFNNLIVLKNKNNKGVAYSRNRAFSIANGEYIAIQDADDISLPSRFQKQVEYLDFNKNIDFIGGHAVKINESGLIIGNMIYPPEFTKNAFKVISLYKLNPIIDPSSMFRAIKIIDIGGYRMDEELKTVQDFDLWCRLLVSGKLLYNIQEPIIKYRINPNGVTRQKKQEQMEATDIVWSSFSKRSFPIVSFDKSLFKQEMS